MNALKIAAPLAVAVLIASAPNVSAAEPMVGHMVFFKLSDSTDANKAKLVAACDKYLSKHPGTVYYSAGARGEEFDREVNATDWDVALHVVFENKAAHDKYQTAEQHLKFIAENKDLWATVKVYDSLIKKAGDGE